MSPLRIDHRIDFGDFVCGEAGTVGRGDHLLQRRIGLEAVREAAWVVRIGAGELDGRRRAVRTAEVGEHGGAVGHLVGHADDRVEPVEGVIAVQGGAQLIGQPNIRRRVPPGNGHRQRGDRRQGVDEIRASAPGVGLYLGEAVEVEESAAEIGATADHQAIRSAKHVARPDRLKRKAEAPLSRREKEKRLGPSPDETGPREAL